jgi:uncharacterized protein
VTLPHLFQQGSDSFLFFPHSARLYELSGAAVSLLSEINGTDSVLAPAQGGMTSPSVMSADQLSLYDELRGLLHHESEVPAPAATAPEAVDLYNSFHSFSIYLAQTCNMSCSYCWNRGGSFGRSSHLMGVADASAITELIATVAAHSTEEVISVNFYGGEPLVNFPVLRQITLDLLRRGETLGKSFRFAIDTNGSLLQGKTVPFLAQHFSHVGVSLDGREEIHNAQRPGKHGERTWRRIVKNLDQFPNRDILGLRATLTCSSDPYLETFRQLTSLGVRRIQLEYCHQPGYHHDPSFDVLLVPLERQLAELREFLLDYLGTICRYGNTGEIPFVSNLLHEIGRLWRGNRATRPCGAGTNAIAINSHGQIFPCVAFVNQERFRMAQTAGSGSLSLLQPLKEFDSCQKPCRSCWLRYDCAGGCYTIHFDRAGNAKAPHPDYCLAMRSKAELYLWAMAQMQKRCPWHLEI